jgi:CheY-like chemotaxis protein
MPEMDGYEATQVIRERERQGRLPGRGRLPIVALTANAMAADRDRCLTAGMDAYLAKPLRPPLLASILERFVQAEEAQAPPSGPARHVEHPRMAG